MAFKQYKLGIIGSRLLEDINFDSDYRNNLQDKILNVINTISGTQEVIGLTGLNLGTEQDFGVVCEKHKLEYILILAFPKQEKGWKNLEDSQDMYKFLAKRCSDKIVLSDVPHYSPKKHIKRNKHIVDMADGIIFIPNEINSMEEIISYASGQAKDIYIINGL